MGLLLDTRSGRLVTLAARTLVGRSPACLVQIDDPRASAEHAAIAWSGEAWEVRDLGSLNGTWLDGRRLAAGARAELRRDARLAFGGGEPWIVADDRALGETGHVSSTHKVDDAPPRLADISLGFTPSQDEEHVDVVIRTDGKEWLLPPRSSHYMLLTLARARLEDERNGVAPAECGWLHASHLATMLRYSAERLNLEIFRARSQLAKLGLVDATQLIERRTVARQLRIGVARMYVTRK